jgi:uncharacterized protein (DUF433 family)
MPIAMDSVTEDMRRAIERLRERGEDQEGRVEKRRYTVGHETVVAGTRIPTRTIWQLHRAGYDSARIRREYPRLTDRDVNAALEFEGRLRAS